MTHRASFRWIVVLTVCGLLAAILLVQEEDVGLPGSRGQDDGGPIDGATGCDGGHPTVIQRVAVPQAPSAELPPQLRQPIEFTLEVTTLDTAGPSPTGGLLIMGHPLAGLCQVAGEASGIEPGVTYYRVAAREREVCIIVDTGYLRRVVLRYGERQRLISDGSLPSAIAPALAWRDVGPPPRASGGHITRPSDLAAFEDGPENEEPVSSIWGTSGGVEFAGLLSSLRTIVTDETGMRAIRPTVRVWVGAEPDNGSRWFRAWPSPDRVPYGRHVVMAGEAEHGWGALDVLVNMPSQEVEVKLSRGVSVEGRVTDDAGEGVVGARVIWLSSSGEIRANVITDDDGAFRITNLGSSSGDVWGSLTTNGAILPSAGIRGVPAGSSNVVVRMPSRVVGGTMVLAVTLPQGVDPELVAARLWHMESGIGIHMRACMGEGRLAFTAGCLPRGWYEVEFGSPEIGWSSAGLHHVEGGDCVAIGPVVAETCWVMFQCGRSDVDMQRWDVISIRRDMNVRVQRGDRSWTEWRALPSGEYAVVWADGAGRRRCALFTLEPRTRKIVQVD